jgi:hypothetical protein
VKKKLIKFAMEIATGNTYTKSEPCIWKWVDPIGMYPDRFFVADGCRILELPEPFEGLPVRDDIRMTQLCVKFMNEALEGNKTAFDLPEPEEIKRNITALRGRKYSIPVAFKMAEDRACFNAGYLLEGMKALNAGTCYSEAGNMRSPAWIYLEDDLASVTKYMVLPVNSTDNKVGYFAPPVENGKKV